jgi:hypothetical protein
MALRPWPRHRGETIVSAMDVGDREKVWTVEVVLEERSSTTEALARLRSGDLVVGGWGRARRNPADADQPLVGDELAAARALSDLAHHLMELAAAAIAAPAASATPASTPHGGGVRAGTVSLTPPAVQHQREGLRQAMVALEEAAAQPGAGRPEAWAGDVAAALYQVSAALHEHLEVTEGDDGLFADIRAPAPRLAHAIDRLRKDHAQLSEAVAETRAELAVVPPESSEAWLDARRGQVTELLMALSRHRQRGADLTYDAFSAELGDAG